MLQTEQFPTGIASLATGLPNMQIDNFSHCEMKRKMLAMSSKKNRKGERQKRRKKKKIEENGE